MSRVFTEDELRTYKSHTEQQLRATVADRDRTIGTLQRRLATCKRERDGDKVRIDSRDRIIESLKAQFQDGIGAWKEHIAAAQVEVDQPKVETCSVCGAAGKEYVSADGRGRTENETARQ